MDFTNTFTVRAPLQRVWEFLLDAYEVAPCVPGAEITEAIGERQFRGTVKVKLGAVQVVYRGELEQTADEAARTITLNGKGTEQRGGGGARGSATVTLEDQGAAVTQVTVQSHVDVTGRVAQFGRGIMQDVTNRLINEFARCLEQKIQAGADASDALVTEDAGETESSGPAPRSRRDESAPVDSGSSHSEAVNTGTGTGTRGSAMTRAEHQIELMPLVISVARGRLAAGLRRLARLIEPE